MDVEPPHYIAERVRQALATDPRTSEMDLHVRVHGDKVFVTGTVPTAERCAAIEQVAREMAPDLHVINQATIYETAEPQGQERLA
jgi:osmotically-inducible protein OsmY